MKGCEESSSALSPAQLETAANYAIDAFHAACVGGARARTYSHWYIVEMCKKHDLDIGEVFDLWKTKGDLYFERWQAEMAGALDEDGREAR